MRTISSSMVNISSSMFNNKNKYETTPDSIIIYHLSSLTLCSAKNDGDR